jgi:hypothetical protein
VTSNPILPPYADFFVFFCYQSRHCQILISIFSVSHERRTRAAKRDGYWLLYSVCVRACMCVRERTLTRPNKHTNRHTRYSNSSPTTYLKYPQFLISFAAWPPGRVPIALWIGGFVGPKSYVFLVFSEKPSNLGWI